MTRRKDEIAEGWGAYWIDGLECDFCDADWGRTGGYPDGPSQQQYIELNLRLRDKDRGLNLCPDCADDLSQAIDRLLDQDVPMGMRPGDTDRTCALHDDFYVWGLDIGSLWWDEDGKCLRNDTDEMVKVGRTTYKRALRELKRREGDWGTPMKPYCPWPGKRRDMI